MVRYNMGWHFFGHVSGLPKHTSVWGRSVQTKNRLNYFCPLLVASSCPLLVANTVSGSYVAFSLGELFWLSKIWVFFFFGGGGSMSLTYRSKHPFGLGFSAKAGRGHRGHGRGELLPGCAGSAASARRADAGGPRRANPPVGSWQLAAGCPFWLVCLKHGAQPWFRWGLIIPFTREAHLFFQKATYGQLGVFQGCGKWNPLLYKKK